MAGRYEYTADWASRAQANWREFLPHLAHTKMTYLEIGVFEGRSGCWMLENILTHDESRYIGIDSWPFYLNRDGAVVEARARANLATYPDKAELIRGESQWVLRQPRWKLETIDVAYIDGDHSAQAVLTDSVLLWPVVKRGGILIWDDCSHRRKNRPVRHAIQAFLSCFSGQFLPLFSSRLQYAVRKIAPEPQDSTETAS